MRIKLTKLETGAWALVLDPHMLELLTVTPEGDFDLTVERGRLELAPRNQRILEAAKRIMDAHDATMRRLAQ